MEHYSSSTEQTQNDAPQLIQHYSSRQSSPKKTQKISWKYLYITIASITLLVVVFFLIGQITQPGSGSTSVSSNELKSVVQTRTSEFDTIGTGGLANPLNPIRIKNLPIETGTRGKPLFFSSGAEFCPYCAAQRWAIVVALSQFGTFHKINRITSSENEIATFTFQGSIYTSPYLDFVSLEGSQDSAQVTKPFNSQQEHILSVYDAPPYVPATFQRKIPFIDIANRYVIAGATFDVQVLIDHSWQEIVNNLSNAKSSITQGIIGAANYMTAAICTVTQEQPTTVCTRTSILHIQRTLNG